MTRFVINPVPLPGESTIGYLIRLVERNAFPKFNWLTGLLSERLGRRIGSPLDIVIARDLLQEIERLTDLPADTLTSRQIGKNVSHEGIFLTVDGWDYFNGAMAIEQHQVCPECLKGSAHHKQAWIYYHAPICAEHKVQLVDQCPECGQAISANRSAVCYCEKCGFDLRRIDPEPVSDLLALLAGLIQQGRMIPLGTAAYDEPISPVEMYYLWCLAFLPKPGQPVMPKLQRGGSISVGERVAALEVLANAWDGKRVNSKHLRSLLVKRWDHLKAIPSRTLISTRLAKAYRALEYGPEPLSVLLTDQPESDDHWTIQAFGKRPPTWKTPEDASEFLGIPASAFIDLSRHPGLSAELYNEGGYDGDRILAMREYLDSLLSEEQVDTAIGVPGAAAQLEQSKLLCPWKGLEAQEFRYPPHDLADLFDRVFERLSPSDENDGVSLEARFGSDSLTAESIIGILVAVLNSAVTPIDWRPPYRLVDLVMAREVATTMDLNFAAVISPSLKTG